MPRPLLNVSQTDTLIRIVDINHTPVYIYITYWMANSADPDKPTDLDLHYLRRQGISGFSRTGFKIPLSLQNKIAFSPSTVTTPLANSTDAKLMILLLYLTFTNNAYLFVARDNCMKCHILFSGGNKNESSIWRCMICIFTVAQACMFEYFGLLR